MAEHALGRLERGGRLEREGRLERGRLEHALGQRAGHAGSCSNGRNDKSLADDDDDAAGQFMAVKQSLVGFLVFFQFCATAITHDARRAAPCRSVCRRPV